MKIQGARTLIQALKKRGQVNDIRKVVTTNASELQRNAQKNAAVDTGFMRRSISLEYDDFGLTARVKPRAEYAPYVEYGTRYMNAQPFMRPALKSQEKRFIDDLNKLMK